MHKRVQREQRVGETPTGWEKPQPRSQGGDDATVLLEQLGEPS